MIIVWFFKYIKYRLHYKSGRNYLHKRIPPMSLKEYITISRYIHEDIKLVTEATKNFFNYDAPIIKKQNITKEGE